MREFRLIKEAIKNFELNLSGITVLTEAASGNFVWTPIIAALSGAKVLAYSKDSKYASYREVKEMTEYYARQLFIENNLTVINVLNKEVISSADIITNNGFLRPLNKKILQYCKKNVVIALMYEAWEFRNSDLDIKYCTKNGIPVLGTNEADSRLKTIEYLGAVVKKALYLNNIEIFKSNICILGYGKFAKVIYNSLKEECDYLEIWHDRFELNIISKLDALVVADHETNQLYIGNQGLIPIDQIKKLNPDILIIHISGNIELDDLKQSCIKYFPKVIAKPKWMSLTTDFTGPKPVIDLHTAGLKVGEKGFNFIKNGNKLIDLQKIFYEDLLLQKVN